MGAYGASKAALEAMAVALNSEIYSLGIDTVVMQAGSHSTAFGSKVETSAREDVWEAYGPIGQAGKTMIAGLDQYFASEWLSTPESVGEQIAEFINMPKDQRPLKVGVGVGSEGFDLLNDTTISLQRKAIELAGLGPFLSRAASD